MTLFFISCWQPQKTIVLYCTVSAMLITCDLQQSIFIYISSIPSKSPVCFKCFMNFNQKFNPGWDSVYLSLYNPKIKYVFITNISIEFCSLTHNLLNKSLLWWYSGVMEATLCCDPSFSVICSGSQSRCTFMFVHLHVSLTMKPLLSPC